MTNNL